MKLVKGKTLAQALHDCKTLGERLQLLSHFLDLCHAIAYAHSRGVIHRDIKPGNVMVGQFGETVVLDWGLAKVRDSEDANVAKTSRTHCIFWPWMTRNRSARHLTGARWVRRNTCRPSRPKAVLT